MVEIPTGTQTEENFSSGSEMRTDARISVSERGVYTVQVQLGHRKFLADCVDYSPFGLGLKLPVEADLPLISIGEPVDLECNFLGSKFNARGTIANTRLESTESGRFVRIGVALSRSAEVVRPSNVKRRSARIQMSDSVAPLVCVADELRFGEMIFAKMTDVSQGGMRLLVDRTPLPFMEKQRYWFDVNLPFFGVSRAFCRIAYVVRDEATRKYWVGCEFIDGGEEQDLRALQDWLFYSHSWLKRVDIIAAGFSLDHITEFDEQCRVTLSSDEIEHQKTFNAASEAGNDTVTQELQALEFVLSTGDQIIRVQGRYSTSQKTLSLTSIEGHDLQLKHGASFWKAMFLFSIYNMAEVIKMSESVYENAFFRHTTNVASAQAISGFATSELTSGSTLNFSTWRTVTKDLSRRTDLKIPAARSIIRRLLLLW